MSTKKKMNIGFLLTYGFRAADVVETQAVLGVHPKNKCFYIAENMDCVYGKSEFPIHPNTTFKTCPKLDVLVVGEVAETQLENRELISFIKRMSSGLSYLLGISNGVVILGNAGLIAEKQVTCDSDNLGKLKEYGAIPVDQRQTVIDGSLYTSGPSTGAIESAFLIMRDMRGDFITKLIEFNLEYEPKQQYPRDNDAKRAKTLIPKTDKKLKVGIFTPPGIFVPDVIGAADVLGSVPGSKIHYLWKEKGKSHGLICPDSGSDTMISQCPQLDVLVVGAVLPKYSGDQEILDFFIKQEHGGASIVSICAGSLLVGGAGLLKGKKAITNLHMMRSLPHLGATVSHNAVESDGSIFSAGPVMGSYEAALVVVKSLIGEDMARYIEQDILEYEPHPVFGIGTPELAGKRMTKTIRTLSMPIDRYYRRIAKRAYKRNNK